MLIDARLLHLYYAKIGDALTNEQKRAIAGVAQLDDVGSSAPLTGTHPRAAVAGGGACAGGLAA